MCKLIPVSALVLALSLAAAPSPAAARGGGSDWRECNGRDLDARISACTRILDRGRDSANNRAGAYNNRGIAYFSKGEFERAIKDFDDAIQLKPNNVVLHHNRGLAYYGKGETSGRSAPSTRRSASIRNMRWRITTAPMCISR